MPPPPVLTIAGSDCSGGAGIQADMKSISANGGYALTALTSVVSETPGLVSQIRLLDADFIVDQIREPRKQAWWVVWSRFMRSPKLGVSMLTASRSSSILSWSPPAAVDC